MKQIQPFTIWVNGKTVIATFMALLCNSDNLTNQAVFYWAFYDTVDTQPGNKLTDGNITMISPDYDLWETNDFAWNWAANQLGVTIIPQTIEEVTQLNKGKAKTV